MKPVFTALLCASSLAMFGLAPVSAQAQTTVNVTLRDGAIQPPQITAQEHKDLRIEVENQGTKVHNFVIPDFYIFTSNLAPGEETSVEFKPAKAGTFQYYSDKNGIPEPGMKGTLVVTPSGAK